MTNLKQISNDAFNSALRRFPSLKVSFDSGYQIQKIYEEVHELEDAYLGKIAGEATISTHCRDLTTVEEELADVILACLVLAKLENIDIGKVLRVKNEYNKTRV